MREGWLATPGRVQYAGAYDAMHALADRRVAGDVPDTLVLLEHPPVYTLGRRADPSHVLFDDDRLAAMGAEVHRVDRGGSVTFHGPGQLVGYPVIDLGPAADVIEYLRMLEEAVIRACADLGSEVGRSERFTGVWAGDRKVCAIGVKVTRGVTLHGFALNCATDLSWFGAIVPCGLADRGVTSLSELTGREVTVSEALAVVARRFEEVFGRRLSPAPESVSAAFRTPRRTASVPA